MDGLNVQYVPARTTGGGGGTTISVQDEGVLQSATVNTLNFTGANVVASGGGAVGTVAIGGVQSVASADGTVTVQNGTTTADLSVNVLPPSMVMPNIMQRTFSSVDYFNTGFSAPVGCTQSTSGTNTNSSRGSSVTDPLTVSRRCNFLSTAAINVGAGVNLNSGVQLYRNNATWGGGFEAFWAFGCEAINANSRLCVGLVTAAFIPGIGAEPSAAASYTAAGGFYIGFDSTDANIQVMPNNGNASPAVKTDTGISRPTNANWMKIWIWCDANASGLTVRIEKHSTAGVSVYTATFTATIPLPTQVLLPSISMDTGPTIATAVRLALQKIICATYKP